MSFVRESWPLLLLGTVFLLLMAFLWNVSNERSSPKRKETGDYQVAEEFQFRTGFVIYREEGKEWRWDYEPLERNIFLRRPWRTDLNQSVELTPDEEEKMRRRLRLWFGDRGIVFSDNW